MRQIPERPELLDGLSPQNKMQQKLVARILTENLRKTHKPARPGWQNRRALFFLLSGSDIKGIQNLETIQLSLLNVYSPPPYTEDYHEAKQASPSMYRKRIWLISTQFSVPQSFSGPFDRLKIQSQIWPFILWVSVRFYFFFHVCL